MHMHVNQAGQDSFTGHIDMRNVATPLYGAGIGDAGYAAIRANENSREINGLAG